MLDNLSNTMKKITLIVLMLFTLLSNQVLSQVENEQYQAILHYEIIDNNQSEALDTGDVINFILTATNTGNVGGDGGAYNYTFNDFDANQITLSNNSFVNAYQLEVGEQVESSAWYSISEQSLSSGGVELEVDLFFGGYYFQSNKLRVIFNEELSADILLNGTVSAENNQIKNVADPTEAQDAATKAYIDELIANLQSQIDNLDSTTVTDIDGNTYDYIAYGDQVWTVENAEMVTYRDGTPIPEVTDNTEWADLTTGAWAYYDNDPTKPRLYNWYAVMGIYDSASFSDATLRKEFAPEGWHVPSNAEWTELENYLIANGYNYDGTTTGDKIAKAMASIDGWQNSDGDGTPGNSETNNNSSQFTALPVGERRDDSGSFVYQGVGACFWSSEVISTFEADRRCIYYHIADVRGGVMNKQNGYSIRFVKDN